MKQNLQLAAYVIVMSLFIAGALLFADRGNVVCSICHHSMKLLANN